MSVLLRLYAMGVVSISLLENHPVREARTPLLRKEGSFIVVFFLQSHEFGKDNRLLKAAPPPS